MSLFLDPSGRTTFGLGICARCARKFFLDELHSDPNAPGLMVCRDDTDDYDPYRLPPRAEDQIVLPFCRPDTSIAATAEDATVSATDNYTVWATDFWAGTGTYVDRRIYDSNGNYITDENGNAIFSG